MPNLASYGSNAARIIVLACVCLALAACSSVRLAYNNAPTVGYWWLNGYLDFDDQQSARLREDLSELQQWHRQSQLPAYAALLERGQALARQPQVSAAPLCALVRDAQQQLADIGTQSSPGAAQLALSLTPAQLQHLQDKYSRSNADFRKEWLDLSPAKLHAKRYDKALERAEHFYGRLDETQRALLRRLVDASSFNPSVLQAERLRRQQDAQQTLQGLAGQRATLEQAETAMRGLFARYRESPQAGYRSYAQQQIAEGCEMAAELHNSATPTQREHAIRRIQAYEQDLRALASAR